MQEKNVKDLVIGLGVLAIIAFSFRCYMLFHQVNRVPEESRYSRLALDQNLLNQIQQIEESITERKNFKFTVEKDPLKQDLIVQTRLDLRKQWEDMVRSMMRLTATFKDSENRQKAMIAFGGKDHIVEVGDVINNKKITRITFDEVYFQEGGHTGVLKVEPIPPKPVQLERSVNPALEYNW